MPPSIHLAGNAERDENQQPIICTDMDEMFVVCILIVIITLLLTPWAISFGMFFFTSCRMLLFDYSILTQNTNRKKHTHADREAATTHHRGGTVFFSFFLYFYCVNIWWARQLLRGSRISLRIDHRMSTFLTLVHNSRRRSTGFVVCQLRYDACHAMRYCWCSFRLALLLLQI